MTVSAGRPRAGSRRLRLAVAAAAAVLLLAAHFAWSYLPRVRAGRPAPDGAAASLLAAAEAPGRQVGPAGGDGPAVALWIAYPHQNLAALERCLGRDAAERDRFLAAAARLAGLPGVELPRFGPFAAPPSRELVAVSDAEGRQVLVAARVFPAVAVLARLAGAVAGNPWLSGGEVEAFGGRARVAWDGLRWSVASAGGGGAFDRVVRSAHEEGGGSAGGRTGGSPIPEGPALAILALSDPVSVLPPGVHRLVHDEGGLELASAGAEALPRLPPDFLIASGAAALAVSGPGGPLVDGDDPLAAAAVAIFPADPREAEGGLRGLLRRAVALPGGAVWYRSASGGPARRLLAPLLSGGRTRRPEPGETRPFALAATDRTALVRARALTPTVERLTRELRLGLWLDPGAAFAAVDPAVDFLEAVPLAPRGDVARWRDWRTVLAPLAGYAAVSLVTDGEELRLRLEG